MRLYLRISFAGLVLFFGVAAIAAVLQAGFGGLVFLYLGYFWTILCLLVGFALLAAKGVHRFAKRIAKPS